MFFALSLPGMHQREDALCDENEGLQAHWLFKVICIVGGLLGVLQDSGLGLSVVLHLTTCILNGLLGWASSNHASQYWQHSTEIASLTGLLKIAGAGGLGTKCPGQHKAPQRGDIRAEGRD